MSAIEDDQGEPEMVNYVSITLAVPVEPDEDPPEEWSWNALLDTPHDVFVTDVREIDPGEPIHDRHGNRLR